MKPSDVCTAEGCDRSKEVRRGRINGRFCTLHANRHRRMTDPARVYWHNLKQSAKRRRIGFELSLADWCAWVEQVRFFERREGIETRGDRLSVDRIDPAGPYALHNIRAIPMRENSRAQHTARPVYVRGVRYTATVEAHACERSADDELEEVLARL